MSSTLQTNSMVRIVSLAVRWPLRNQTLVDRFVVLACVILATSTGHTLLKKMGSPPPAPEEAVNPSQKAQAIYNQTQAIPVIDAATNALIRGSIARASRRANESCAQVEGACQMAVLKDLAAVKYSTEGAKANPDDVIATLLISVDGQEHRVELTKDEAGAVLSTIYASSALALDDVARTEAVVSMGDTNEGITQFYESIQPLAEQQVTQNLNKALQAESSPASISRNLTDNGVTPDNAEEVAARYVESSMTRGGQQADPAVDNPQTGK
jgi:hypothetical protein